jgi:hypothetical protein
VPPPFFLFFIYYRYYYFYIKKLLYITAPSLTPADHAGSIWLQTYNIGFHSVRSIYFNLIQNLHKHTFTHITSQTLISGPLILNLFFYCIIVTPNSTSSLHTHKKKTIKRQTKDEKKRLPNINSKHKHALILIIPQLSDALVWTMVLVNKKNLSIQNFPLSNKRVHK